MLLQTHEVSVRFGGVTALDGVSIGADESMITGLIGPNGAGKTTLFNVITGLQTPSAGRVLFDGQDINGLSVHRRAQLGLARTFQRLELFGSMTVRENVQTAAEICELWRRQDTPARARTQEILDRVGLQAVADAPAHTLPTGLARLTELARALATSPRLLLLDEPGSGLDTTESVEFAALLGALAEEGAAILLVEHDMDLVMRSCTQIHVLDFGVHIASGTPSEIQSDSEVRRAYLGQSQEARA
ncbi:MAG: ABC transporter ATP-binding protein [Acidimicrobiia bacterium]|nr:ABC transporter ATP-binding protein [Acidimicrobiia bacterium]